MFRLLLLGSLLLEGCSLSTTVTMKCDGKCELEMNREVSAGDPVPTVPEGFFKK